jgi:hypothetical protein
MRRRTGRSRRKVGACHVGALCAIAVLAAVIEHKAKSVEEEQERGWCGRRPRVMPRWRELD